MKKAAGEEDEPMSRLASAAAEIHLQVTPTRLPVVKALWKAHHDTPLVFSSETESR
ncbi:hypothetical protein N9I65_02010 [bacterium]|nr:hypothetical protein [bacterium]